ncbi:hypothetical protein ACPCUF_23925 [Streptomyces griseoincarnatus]
MSLFGRRERREIAELEEYVDRLRAERDAARRERDAFRHAGRLAASKFAEADAANRRLEARNLELGRRVTALAESDPEYAAQIEQQLAEAREELAAEKRRAEHLQQRLDDAVGLTAKGIQDSGRWQPGYKPAPKPEVAS